MIFNFNVLAMISRKVVLNYFHGWHSNRDVTERHLCHLGERMQQMKIMLYLKLKSLEFEPVF